MQISDHKMIEICETKGNGNNVLTFEQNKIRAIIPNFPML